MKKVQNDKALDNDSRELHEALSELVRVYQFRDRKRICYRDVSVTQCYAMDALVRKGAMSLNGLAEELFLDKSTASRVIDSLERKGYVTRSVDPHDGRARLLKITKEGHELHSRIESELAEGMKAMIADFDPDIRQATISLVARLARAASKRFSST